MSLKEEKVKVEEEGREGESGRRKAGTYSVISHKHKMGRQSSLRGRTVQAAALSPAFAKLGK